MGPQRVREDRVTGSLSPRHLLHSWRSVHGAAKSQRGPSDGSLSPDASCIRGIHAEASSQRCVGSIFLDHLLSDANVPMLFSLAGRQAGSRFSQVTDTEDHCTGTSDGCPQGLLGKKFPEKELLG